MDIASPPAFSRAPVSLLAAAQRVDPPREDRESFTLEGLRLRGVRFLIIGGWVMNALGAALALLTNPQVWWVVAFGLMINSAVTIGLRKDRSTFSDRLLMLGAACTSPPCLVLGFLLGGREINPLIPHMVMVIVFIALYDRRIVAIGTAISMVSFTTLKLAMPSLDASQPMFWLATSMELVGILSVAVISASVCGEVQKLMRSLETSREDAAKRNTMLDEQSSKLEHARKNVEKERREREEAEAAQRKERQAELQRFASDFETSISVVTQSISETAALLEKTTKSLSVIAHDTGQEAAHVSEGAATASHAARMLAKGVAELSSSIAGIAVDASQQNALAAKATKRSNVGGEAVAGLTKHSDTIGEATRAIVRIAERTNLLSLNAAIEAASAGPAGRGFTIVAQEVKALAMQASEAATEIDDFLKGVRASTLEAERNFEAIDSAIGSLADTSTAIRWEVESQRKSADAIEEYARSAAEDVGAMAERSETLANSASTAEKISNQLDDAAAKMLANVRDLEQSTAHFVSKLKSG